MRVVILWSSLFSLRFCHSYDVCVNYATGGSSVCDRERARERTATINTA